MNDKLQRTESWYKARLGKFSGSTMGNIMSYPFKKTAMKFILSKYMEKITGQRESFSNIYTEWGNKYESKGIARYEKETGLKVSEVGFILLKGYEEFAGCSPDGLIYEKDKLIGIIECKCPYNPVNFSKAVNQDGIPDNYKKSYYTQIQFNMLVTGVEWCDWFSYEAREDRIFIKRYKRDEEYIDKIKIQLDRAIEVLKGLSSNEATEEELTMLKHIDEEAKIKALKKEEKALNNSKIDLNKLYPNLDIGACEGFI